MEIADKKEDEIVFLWYWNPCCERSDAVSVPRQYAGDKGLRSCASQQNACTAPSAGRAGVLAHASFQTHPREWSSQAAGWIAFPFLWAWHARSWEAPLHPGYSNTGNSRSGIEGSCTHSNVDGLFCAWWMLTWFVQGPDFPRRWGSSALSGCGSQQARLCHASHRGSKMERCAVEIALAPFPQALGCSPCLCVHEVFSHPKQHQHVAIERLPWYTHAHGSAADHAELCGPESLGGRAQAAMRQSTAVVWGLEFQQGQSWFPETPGSYKGLAEVKQALPAAQKKTSQLIIIDICC